MESTRAARRIFGTCANAEATSHALRQARAREIELRMAERAHKLIPTDEALAALTDVLGKFLAGMLSMPARIGGRDLSLRAKIDDEIFRIRTETADWLARQVQALNATGRAMPGAPPTRRRQNQTQRLGRQRAGPLRYMGPPRPVPLPSVPQGAKLRTDSTYDWRKIAEQQPLHGRRRRPVL